MSLRSEVIRIFNELVGSGKKITELPAVSTPLAGTELLEIVQSGVNKKVTASSLSSGGTGVQTIVAGTNVTVDATDPQNPIVSASGGGGGGTWGSITGTLADQTDLQAALDAKQASLGFTPENVANKAINLTSPDNTQYPTTQAVATAIAGVTYPDASETVKGIIEIATQAETNTGTDDVRAITPLKAATRYAPLASPTLTGTPVAPTAAPGTNTTQIATTAYVQSSLTNVGGLLYLYNNFS